MENDSLVLAKCTQKYLDYLIDHIQNVQNAWLVIQEKCKDMNIISDKKLKQEIEKEISLHDYSKFSKYEFCQYRDEFYPYLPKNIKEPWKTFITNTKKKIFKNAVQHHIEHNTHHWETWTHPNMMYIKQWKIHCTHMIADWMAMGYSKGETAQEYYEKNKERIIIPDYAEKFMYEIFDRIKR